MTTGRILGFNEIGASAMGTPFRMLFLCNSHVWGGAERYVSLLAAGMTERGHTCWVAAPSDSPLLDAVTSLRGVVGVRFDIGPKLGKRTIADYLLRQFQYRDHLRRLLVESTASRGIDLLHLQFKKEQLLASAIADDLSIPVVWTEHDRLPTAFARTVPAMALYRNAARIPRSIICVSDYVAGFMRASGIPGHKLAVCYNGVPSASGRNDMVRRSLRAQLGIPPDTLVIGSTSRLHAIKGHAYVLRAIATLSALDLHFLVVGDGPCMPALRSQARDLGIGSRVTFAGHRSDVPDLLSAMDIFVSASSSEGHPFSILEAMATGIPTIGTRVGGTPEVLDHGRAGVLVPDRDATALARVIVQLASSPTARSTLAAAGLQRVRDVYLEDAMLDRTEQILVASLSGVTIPRRPRVRRSQEVL